MPKIRPCPICRRPFTSQSKRVTCSEKCAGIFTALPYKERARLVKAAEAGKRPPLTDCKCFRDDGRKMCIGLTGLWCEWEECKFYKPKFMKKIFKK